MKLQRSTLVLVVGALLLGGVTLFTQARQSNRPTTAQGEAASPVYGFDEADVVSLHIETQTQAVTFQRDEAGFWQMTSPEAHPAEEAAIAFLLSRLTTDGLLRTTTIDAANQAEFGLDVPFATLEITLQDETNHSLVLGDADFSGQNSYALIDPETIPLSEAAGEVTVVLVSDDVLNGVDRPLEEWQAVVETPAETDDAEREAEAGASDAPAAGDAPPIEGDTDAESEAPTPETESGAESQTPSPDAAPSEIDVPLPETESTPVPAPENADPSQ